MGKITENLFLISIGFIIFIYLDSIVFITITSRELDSDYREIREEKAVIEEKYEKEGVEGEKDVRKIEKELRVKVRKYNEKIEKYNDIIKYIPFLEEKDYIIEEKSVERYQNFDFSKA